MLGYAGEAWWLQDLTGNVNTQLVLHLIINKLNLCSVSYNSHDNWNSYVRRDISMPLDEFFLFTVRRSYALPATIK